jgi:hypothetical protein
MKINENSKGNEEQQLYLTSKIWIQEKEEKEKQTKLEN